MKSRVNLIAIATIGLGLGLHLNWLAVVGCAVASIVSVPIIYRSIRQELAESFSPALNTYVVAGITLLCAVLYLMHLSGVFSDIISRSDRINWIAVGTVGLWSGALCQMLIAIFAVYVAWRQYVISRRLTVEQNRLTFQQNVLTQQQTIDNYFQGICELVLDDDGFLEDWPQERSFAVGRTAALLSSVNAAGKARVLRFLSRSKLLTPLRRDGRLNRPILDGNGGYEEDRVNGTRIVDLGVMLSGVDISDTDLRSIDLSEANLVRADLSRCDLSKANLARTILDSAKLIGTNLKGSRLFYGTIELATPCTRTDPPNYMTGEFTGAVVTNVDFTNVRELSEAQRQYCCAWCGAASRQTIPGGCEGILDRSAPAIAPLAG
jgi:uncharacterized protein YjbI with pentapeptide repeats